MHFSIIIPLYNKALYIRRTIESVLAQSMRDFEVIVVDDGSSDGGAQIVEAIADNRIRLVLQTNGGVSVARNRGIELARGDWIAFLDADDWFHPNYLATLDRLVSQYSAVDIVATRYKSVEFINGEDIEPWPVLPQNAAVELISDLPTRWMEGAVFFTSSIAVRASVLRATNPLFPVGESFGEDLDLWFRLAETSTIALSTDALVARVWVPGSLSSEHVAIQEAPFLLRMADRTRRHAMAPRLVISTQRFVDEHRISLARAAIGAGERLMAAGLLKRAHRGARRPRWWLTALMALLVPGIVVKRWQHWRYWRNRQNMVIK